MDICSREALDTDKNLDLQVIGCSRAAAAHFHKLSPQISGSAGEAAPRSCKTSAWPPLARGLLSPSFLLLRASSPARNLSHGLLQPPSPPSSPVPRAGPSPRCVPGALGIHICSSMIRSAPLHGLPASLVSPASLNPCHHPSMAPHCFWKSQMSSSLTGLFTVWPNPSLQPHLHMQCWLRDLPTPVPNENDLGALCSKIENFKVATA